LPEARPGIDWIYAANGIFKRGTGPDISLQARVCPIDADVPGLAQLLPCVRWASWPWRVPGELLPALLKDAQRAGADGSPAQKHARGAVDEGAEQSNKFTGDEVLSRVPTTAQGGAVRSALPLLHPVNFYGAGQQAVASAARQVASWVVRRASVTALARPSLLANPAVARLLVTPQGNVTGMALKAAPARDNVAGSSRLVPLEIGSDDDDQPAQGLAAPALRADTRWLTAPRPPPTRDVWPVVVESDRAWIGALSRSLRPRVLKAERSACTAGLCQVQNCRLEFMNDRRVLPHGAHMFRTDVWHSRVSLRARRYDGVDIHYPDLPNDGIVTKLRSAYNTKDESQWPVCRRFVESALALLR
jgi:hypothetical protein